MQMRTQEPMETRGEAKRSRLGYVVAAIVMGNLALGVAIARRVEAQHSVRTLDAMDCSKSYCWCTQGDGKGDCSSLGYYSGCGHYYSDKKCVSTQ